MPIGRLRDLIGASLAALPSGPIAVAYSGGLDSSVLLHGLAGLPAARERGLRAIHIDHGLQDTSREWASVCIQVCSALDVPLTVLSVDVELSSGLGLEAAARRARFSAMQSALAEGEIVAFAHHRDDQAETVLLKLLRGAGPEGLSAMRKLRRFGHGHAWRPLLGAARTTLRTYADQAGLVWISDPSNANPLIDRNYLRLEVLPRVRKRWPEADASITQSAEWIRAAADFIDEQSALALARVQGLDPATLRYRQWLELPDALRDPVLRRWLRAIDLPEPNRYQVSELVRQLAEAAEHKLPCIRWPGAEIRRYRDLVHALRPMQLPEAQWRRPWDGVTLPLPAGLGALRLVDNYGRDITALAEQPFAVRFRRGGETLRLSSNGYTRELRDLFQEAGIPPWERGRIPIVVDADEQLLAIADLWTSDAGRKRFAQHACRLVWEHALTPA
ncbi:tRNA lysidine(34) synthetase TilS [Dokdonella sp.]|uniref:tRNA lysidine(34) synthetase TilS n=1 Tax=Dokdonella sp. TaxID=2291710 RepID=UPI003C53D6EA